MIFTPAQLAFLKEKLSPDNFSDVRCGLINFDILLEKEELEEYLKLK